MPGEDPDPNTRERLILERNRVCDRLRSMSLARLGAALADGRSRAGAALACAQQLADIVGQVASWPVARCVPPLPDHAVGDAVAVMVNDLVAELDLAGWNPQAEASCAEAVRQLVQLRSVL